jgi:hypothetical protein
VRDAPAVSDNPFLIAPSQLFKGAEIPLRGLQGPQQERFVGVTRRGGSRLGSILHVAPSFSHLACFLSANASQDKTDFTAITRGQGMRLSLAI